ncbi:MAG: glycosyltransferase [Flavobacteriaceae bacterium]|nr:glycosyltransferase [Flavobacteriaceae bacterium]
MKILFWVNIFPAFSETFIRDQIISLLDKKMQILIYSNTKSIQELGALKKFEKYNLLAKKVDIKGLNDSKYIRVLRALGIGINSLFKGHLKYYIKSLNQKKYGSNAKTLKLFFQINFILKNKINIIHAHFGPNGINALAIKRIGLPVKLFTTFHGYDIRLGIKDKGKIYHGLFKHSDGVFSISEYNYNYLLKFGANKNTILKLSNGVNVDFYKRKTSVTVLGGIKMLTVARLVEEKSLDIAIKAISLIKEKSPNLAFEYIIVGEGNQRSELQELINSFGLSKYIKLIGAKNSFEVRDLMIESDLFLLSSNSEALPTVLLEAQSCELVVLATNVGSVKNIVKGGSVVEPSDYIAFSSEIFELIESRKKWKQLAKTGRKYIEKYHNIDVQTAKLINYYNA